MGNFWKILLLILLNVIVSASVTYGVLYYWENIRKPKTEYQLVNVGNENIQWLEVSQTEMAETAIAQQQTASAMEVATIAAEPTEEPTPVIRGAKVEISLIRNPGILESEALRIVNNTDDVVSLENWRLEDANGNELTFPNIQLLRKGVFVEVYSRAGHTTPYEVYWNSNEPVWQSGETAVLKDMFGQLQATYRVP